MILGQDRPRASRVRTDRHVAARFGPGRGVVSGAPVADRSDDAGDRPWLLPVHVRAGGWSCAMRSSTPIEQSRRRQSPCSSGCCCSGRRAFVGPRASDGLSCAPASGWPADYGITLFLPVRSSLYAIVPSIGACIAAAVVLSAAWQSADLPHRFRALCAAILLPVCLMPVYLARTASVPLADFSTQVLRDIRDRTHDIPDAGHRRGQR